ncbi:MAG: hypothetical protein COA73_02330 [Candidatus Hydrogenedentota bacterium]|nr:MAG: hypothetical protein COA73_02330 [Candidatus Hydrogenedentota bacterium]
MPESGEPTYYERMGPVKGRLMKAYHVMRLVYKAMFNKGPLVVLLEIKWRLGDEIMALPVYDALWKSHLDGERGDRVAVWCNYPELLENNPHVDSVNDKKIDPDVYVLLRGTDRFTNRQDYYEDHMKLEFMSGRPALYFENWDSPLLEEISTGDTPLIALNRGATWDTKQWPKENWNALGQALELRGYRVIVLGQDGETIDAGTSFVARTDVRDAAVLLHEAALTVAHDSGLMHLSLAAGTPVVALFGPTEPRIVVKNDPRLHSIRNGRECQGCWNREGAMERPGVCPLKISDCMSTISLESIVETVEKLAPINR